MSAAEVLSRVERFMDKYQQSIRVPSLALHWPDFPKVSCSNILYNINTFFIYNNALKQAFINYLATLICCHNCK